MELFTAPIVRSNFNYALWINESVKTILTGMTLEGDLEQISPSQLLDIFSSLSNAMQEELGIKRLTLEELRYKHENEGDVLATKGQNFSICDVVRGLHKPNTK